jgi:hypothetical protein
LLGTIKERSQEDDVMGDDKHLSSSALPSQAFSLCALAPNMIKRGNGVIEDDSRFHVARTEFCHEGG